MGWFFGQGFDSPHIHSVSVAQLVEHPTFNRVVAGSNPVGRIWFFLRTGRVHYKQGFLLLFLIAYFFIKISKPHPGPTPGKTTLIRCTAVMVTELSANQTGRNAVQVRILRAPLQGYIFPQEEYPVNNH